MTLWRWVVTDSSRPICKQESGQNQDFHKALTEVESIINYFIDLKNK
jgi:hypothetical protein